MELVRRRAPDVLAGLFGISGVVHLLRPQVFDSLVPRWLPDPRSVIYLSGIAELICASGLVRRTRWAANASALLLVAIFPGNVEMALQAASRDRGHFTAEKALPDARLPVQLVLIWAALQARRRSGMPRADAR